MNATETVLATAQRLQQAGTPYALVSVIRAQAPASARPGDKAVVTADGQLHGWVGGGCAQPAVLKTVRQVLADGRARLIRIAPSDEGEVRDLEVECGLRGSRRPGCRGLRGFGRSGLRPSRYGQARSWFTSHCSCDAMARRLVG